MGVAHVYLLRQPDRYWHRPCLPTRYNVSFASPQYPPVAPLSFLVSFGAINPMALMEAVWTGRARMAWIPLMDNGRALRHFTLNYEHSANPLV